MTSRAVTELLAARRYLNSVLLQLSIDAEHITAFRLLELLDYFAQHPTEYIQITMNIEKLPDYDVLDVVLLCHAALAQDSPEFPTHYLNQILNIMFGYLTSDQRQEVEVYLAEKKYLPPLKLHLPNS